MKLPTQIVVTLTNRYDVNVIIDQMTDSGIDISNISTANLLEHLEDTIGYDFNNFDDVVISDENGKLL